MEAEGGNIEGINGVIPLVIEQTFPIGTVDIEITETVPVPTDYTNTRYGDISSLGTSISQHRKVDAPGTKPDKTFAAPNKKGAAVPDEKGAADKTIPTATQGKKSGTVYDQSQKRKDKPNSSSSTYSSDISSKSSSTKHKKMRPKKCHRINEEKHPYEDKYDLNKATNFSPVDYNIRKKLSELHFQPKVINFFYQIDAQTRREAVSRSTIKEQKQINFSDLEKNG